MTFVLAPCVQAKEKVYSRQRKHMHRHRVSRESDLRVVRTLAMCWWEGVADEARMMRGSERTRALAITL